MSTKRDGNSHHMSQRSVPVTFSILPKGFGEVRIAFSAADRPLDQINPPPQIGEPGGSDGSVERGRHGTQL